MFYDYGNRNKSRLSSNSQREYKRALTIKLPLPTCDKEAFSDDDICVMAKHSDAPWDLLDVPIKLVKNHLSFDTKSLCR